MTTYTTFDTPPSSEVVLSGGNLIATKTSGAAYAISTRAVQVKTSGKLYAEFTINALAAALNQFIGVIPSTISIAYPFEVGWTGGDDGWSYYANDGKKAHSASMAVYGASYGVGAIISVLLDIGAGTLSFWKNGIDQGVAYSGLPAGSYRLCISQYGTTPQCTANFGATAFAYTPPAEYEGWGAVEPSVGNGAVTLQSLTATGSRIAAGDATLSALTATGGYNGIGAGTLEQLVLAGGGGIKTGTVTMAAFTASGTGYPAASGAATFNSLTATGTGYDSAIWTVEVTSPAPTLSSSILTGEAITFAGEAPAPLLEIGTKDARLIVPVPILSATVLTGTVSSIAVTVSAPVVDAINFNPAIITIEGLARVPLLTATLLAGQIGTASLILRPPYITATNLIGSTATLALEAVTPILAAAGYPAYTITFANFAPVPRLVAALGFAVSENYKTWCLNVRKGALTEYDNFNFNSYCVFQGQILAASSSGIVTLGTQSLDNATAITAKVRSGKDSFGSSFHKRVPRAYIGYTPGGDLYFRMITPEGGERTYLLGWNRGTDLQQRRIPIGKGPRSRYWQWEIENVAGADFSVDNVMLYPTVLRRRVQ